MSDIPKKEPSAEEAASETDSFALQLANTLNETQEELSKLSTDSESLSAASWERARGIIERFQPVPWFIWRLSNYVFGQSGKTAPKVSEGFVLGLRKIIFAAASDRVLGAGEKVDNMKKALAVMQPDVVAAVAAIYAVNKRLASCQFERMWKPMLDDAILRCHIGWHVGARNPSFGSGRGMLAGYAGRSGLAVLIATGELDQARKSLELLATGVEISQVGFRVYKCDPLQVSALMLSACGCGRDAAMGTVMYGSPNGLQLVKNDDQKKWLAAYSITDSIRTGRLEEVPKEYWALMSFDVVEERERLSGDIKKMVRRGHGWNWLL